MTALVPPRNGEFPDRIRYFHDDPMVNAVAAGIWDRCILDSIDEAVECAEVAIEVLEGYGWACVEGQRGAAVTDPPTYSYQSPGAAYREALAWSAGDDDEYGYEGTR